MDRDNQAPLGPQSSAKPACCNQAVVCAALIGSATLGCLVGIGLVSGLLHVPHTNGYAQERPAAHKSDATDLFASLQLFKDWDYPVKPALVILLSGEEHGYLQPCGCSNPQYGGLTRRYNLIQLMRQNGWPVVAADVGDISDAPEKRTPQTLLKYKYFMMALDIMGYTAVNVGEYEMKLPLQDALATYSLNNPTPRVVTINLLDRQPGQQFHDQVFDSALASKPKEPKVGFFGSVSQSVVDKVKHTNLKFDSDSNGKLHTDTLRKLKSQGADLIVLLGQGTTLGAKEYAESVAKARKQDATYPNVDVILCLGESPLPPAMPTFVGNTMIVQVGHKGQNVGVVGVFPRKGTPPFELKYQMVSIGPDFDTPAPLQKEHKVMRLMEEFTQELMQDNYLAKFKQRAHPLQAKFPNSEYVGNAKCITCHQGADNIWKASKHAKAYENLVKAENPSRRQFDGECVVCHTVGFGYKTGFENLNKHSFLTDVGCESCHGPGSEHVAKPRNPAIQEAINPFKFRGNAPETKEAKKRRFDITINDMCIQCHNLDNDPHFDIDTYWPKVVHMNPAPK